MLKSLRSFLLLSLIFLPFIANAAIDSPLLIIRFNQPYISYQKSLDRAVIAAVQTKSSVFFDIVSIYPEDSGFMSKNDSKSVSEKLTNPIIDQIKQLGVAEDRIRLTYQERADATFNEVHIFVR
ncbi:hypothetical protein N9W34_03385 [Rickettsiales bacterium]|nr:hypothetical protein [Rickettsiales bacterium]